MGLAIGVKGYVQFVREAAYGAQLAATHRIAVESCTLEAKPQIGESQSLPAAGFSAQPWMADADNQGQYVLGEHSEGQITMPMDYDGLLQFVDMAMGTGTYGTYGAAVSGPSGGVYTHVWQPEKEYLNSMCVQFYEGGVASNAAIFPGLKETGFTLRGTGSPGNDGLIRLTVDHIGRKRSSGAPTGAISMLPRVPLRMSDLTWSDGFLDKTTGVLRDFEFTIKPAILAPVYQMGSNEIREPIRDGLISTTLKMTREYNDLSSFSKFQTGGKMASPPSLQWDEPAGAKQFKIEFQAAAIMSQPQPRPGLKGVMLVETTYKALWSGANGGVTITAKTAQSGAAA